MTEVSTGPQGLTGNQEEVHCCLLCTHFYGSPPGNQAPFYGTCQIGGKCSELYSHVRESTNCPHFAKRTMEDLVAERLAGYRPRPETGYQ